MESNTFPFSGLLVSQTYRPLELALQWSIDASFSDVGPFNFTVEVSETPDFSSMLYTLAAGNNFYVLDTTKQRQSNVLNFYYRVKLITGLDKTYYSSTLICSASGEKHSLYLKAKEIIRKEFVRFRYTGRPGWILKRKNYGEQDPANVDPITGAPLTDRGADLGTGYTGGYYAPLKVTYSREGVENTSQLSEQGFGTSAQEVQRHRYVGFPHLEPNDILVTADNRRFRYTKVAQTLMPGSELLLVQSCEASLLPPTDPIYNIPI